MYRSTTQYGYHDGTIEIYGIHLYTYGLYMLLLDPSM